MCFFVHKISFINLLQFCAHFKTRIHQLHDIIMCMSQAEFVFNPYPIRYQAKYSLETQGWHEEFHTLPHAENEDALSEKKREALLEERNYAQLPLVNYTTQYGLSCFEGLKAYPQAQGGMALFRPNENAKRFYNSMQGIFMPPFPTNMFRDALHRVILNSRELGYTPAFEEAWKESNFATAKGIYVRPFSYSEGGLGVNISTEPWVIIVATEVENYFEIVDCPALLVSKRIRATAHGTGAIKCSANYLTSALAKQEAHNSGYNEALFLDGQEQAYVEECSSCNVFFVLEDDTIITPELGDTILPGITRDSVIRLARDAGYRVEERKVSITEVMENAKECFTTGTAVGVSHFGKLTYKDKSVEFGDGRIGAISQELQKTLKFIQHGLIPDKHNWLDKVY